MKNWINNRPEGWDSPYPSKPSFVAQREAYEAGADALYKAIMEERPCEEEWRLKILAIEFGEISVPEFLEWLREKVLVKEDG